MTNIPRPHAHMPVCHTVQTEHLYTAAWWTCTPSSPTALSATVPFGPILCSILFHPLTAIVCACSQPSHGPSGMPQSHHSRSRLVNAVCRATVVSDSPSSCESSASTYRRFAASQTLSHTHPQPCCEQKTGLPLPQNVVAAKTPKTRPPILSRLAVSLRMHGRALSSTSNALCSRHPSR